MKRLITLVTATLLLGLVQVHAQSDDNIAVNLDGTTNGSTFQGANYTIYDDGGVAGSYGNGYDYHFSFQTDCDPNDSTGYVFGVAIMEYDIASTDTLYIYDGPTQNSPLLAKLNNSYQSTSAGTVFISTSNTSNTITIRFYSKYEVNGEKPAGFKLGLRCSTPCEQSIPIIDSVYEHINLATGEVILRRTLRDVPTSFDTNWATHVVQVTDTVEYGNPGDSNYRVEYNTRDSIVYDSVISIDTMGYTPCATGCIGQGIRLHAHGEYTNLTHYYTPHDSTSIFRWVIDGVNDSLEAVELTAVDIYELQSVGCFNVNLKLTDENGCFINSAATIQIRIAQNPIKTLYDLGTICNNDSLRVSVGVDDPNSSLNLKKIRFEKVGVKTNAVRTFIPDGPKCKTEIPGSECYHAPITFTEFPQGRTVQSASDICAVCVNYEHTFMGDYRISLRCPTYNEAVSLTKGDAILKYGKQGDCIMCDPLAPDGSDGELPSPDGQGAGGGTFTGWPLKPDDGCDSIDNIFGIGLDYCWSRNADYTLVTGDKANVPTRFQPGNWYISASSQDNIISEHVVFPEVPAWFTAGGTTPADRDMNTRKPSDYEKKSDFYSPASDFSELIGCPLNGTWEVVVCDFFGIDNGWVFSWSLDICGVQTRGGCDYQVGIDSIHWRPDTNYATDFRDGKYAGLRITDVDSVISTITSPDTSGRFNIKLSIYDEFGCRWDSITHINTVHSPRPHLGIDTVLCSADSILLNAADRWHNAHTDYLWEPYGDTVSQIYTRAYVYKPLDYVVRVINNQYGLACRTRDTIAVGVNIQPVPSFDPGIYPLEGCEPLVINFNNTTKYGYKYRWEFGDGVISTQKSPAHAYPAGQYSLKYYVESSEGCRDSLILDSLITVYPTPEASFTWDPVFPTVTRPSIRLINTSDMGDGDKAGSTSKYFWEVQYDLDHHGSYQTLLEDSPTYTWKASPSGDLAGDYTVRLITRTDNLGPSGRIVKCADTVESSILIINDFLIFPNVVTPNGDGINDRFVIKNLVEGLGYQKNTLDIYDKWGSRVFHAVNISKDEDFWDPARSNAPTGTYFYHFTGKGQAGEIERNGVIELLR